MQQLPGLKIPDVVPASAHTKNSGSTLDAIFFEALNSKPEWAKGEAWLHPSAYGDYFVDEGLRWQGKYADLLGRDMKFQHDEGTVNDTFEMAYDVWFPADHVGTFGGDDEEDWNWQGLLSTPMPVVFMTHGVPVNRREWYNVTRMLARFCIVVTVDLLGMGDSSKPLAFRDALTDEWLWSWALHAKVFKIMIKDLVPGRKVFLVANDWGAGMVQKFIELYGRQLLLGGSPNSAIALNGYWVQHIGSLTALAQLPYPSDTFSVEAIRFIGTFTSLVESMFHRTHQIHNQYTMGPLQDSYVEVSAYWNVQKNPANTVYKAHAVRVLAEQASVILGNGELLPHHPQKNPRGMRFTDWNVPVLMLWGKQDKMMPEGQVQRFANIVALIKEQRREAGQAADDNLWFTSQVIENAGHFAISDQPEVAANALLHWIRAIAGYSALHRSYWGFTEIARQDEAHVMKHFDALRI